MLLGSTYYNTIRELITIHYIQFSKTPWCWYFDDGGGVGDVSLLQQHGDNVVIVNTVFTKVQIFTPTLRSQPGLDDDRCCE